MKKSRGSGPRAGQGVPDARASSPDDLRRRDAVSRRSRRSVSPPICRQRWRSPDRGSTSLEGRDCGYRRLDHRKQQLHQELHYLSPHHHRQAVSYSREEGHEYSPKYMLPDHQSNSKLSRAITGPQSLWSLDSPDLLPKRSMFLDSRSVSFSRLPEDVRYPRDVVDAATAAALKNAENLASGIGDMDRGIRDSGTILYRSHLRDPYDEGEREVFSRDGSFTNFPPSQELLPFAGSSLTSDAKEDFIGPYRDFRYRQSDEFGRASSSRLLNHPFCQDAQNAVQFSGTLRRPPLSPLTRDENQDYSYIELGHRGRVDPRFRVLDDGRRKTPLDYQGEHCDALDSSFLDIASGRFDEADASRRATAESVFWDQQHALPTHFGPDYQHLEVNKEHLNGSRSELYHGFEMKRTGSHKLESYEERYSIENGAGPMAYKGRSKSPVLSERHVDIYKHCMRSPQGNSHIDNLDIYDPSMEKLKSMHYIMDEGVSQDPVRKLNDPNAFQRLHLPDDSNEIWANERRAGLAHSKRFASRNFQYKLSYRRIPKSADRVTHDNASRHVKHGFSLSSKRQLGTDPSHFHGPINLERKQEQFKPFKYWKKGRENRHGNADSQDGVFPSDGNLCRKTDPPEDSEEFKQQVHKAFLRFTRMLNESSHQRKIYQNEGKAQSLLCCICGSSSKEFVDTHGLVNHAYHSLKVGLRTEHLGFHKALCLLMDWNWLLAPDNAKIYQSRPTPEAKALKEDLILWPPIVIIHNGTIGVKNDDINGPKVVTIERIEEKLRELEFEAGKAKICLGRPSNLSVLLVKFMPTLSGLQEAERLHRHYAERKLGKQDFQGISSKNSNSESAVVYVEEMDELLYGYMATAEDLDKLDQETKKRCLLKSKREIEAIANAALNED